MPVDDLSLLVDLLEQYNLQYVTGKRPGVRVTANATRATRTREVMADINASLVDARRQATLSSVRHQGKQTLQRAHRRY